MNRENEFSFSETEAVTVMTKIIKDTVWGEIDTLEIVTRAFCYT